MPYDLIVIGENRDAQDAAMAAANLGKRVALITHVEDSQRAAHAGHANINVHHGCARFTGPHELEVVQNGECWRLSGDKFVIAVGTRPARPGNIAFDGIRVLNVDEVLDLPRFPGSMIVVGGGATAMHRAAKLARLGVRVTLVTGSEGLLESCDRGIVDALLRGLDSSGVTLCLDDDAIGVDWLDGKGVRVFLESSERLSAECVAFAVGREGRTDQLNLEAAGLVPDERGLLWCNEHQQTWRSNIYGIGDVVGFPTLARLSLDQGRRVVDHAFDQTSNDCDGVAYQLPACPKIAMMGRSEEQLTRDDVPFEAAVARTQTTRPGVSGSSETTLKILFHRATRRVLGIHCLGDLAIEIVRAGQPVLSSSGQIDEFLDLTDADASVTECYRAAAQDGLKRNDTRPIRRLRGSIGPEPAWHRSRPRANAYRLAKSRRTLCRMPPFR